MEKIEEEESDEESSSEMEESEEEEASVDKFVLGCEVASDKIVLCMECLTTNT